MIKFVITAIVSATCFVFFVHYIESRSIFYPTRIMEVTPKDIGLDYEDIYFKTVDNVDLHGWLVKNDKAKATLIFTHGNAGNISHRLDKIRLFREMGLNVFIIDYRGYGKSKGVPSEKGMYNDVLAAFDYLITREDIDKDSIIAYGVSLGGVAAIELALKRSVACLIVDSSFTSSGDVCKLVYPFIPTFLLRTKMDSVNKVNGMLMPKLFIHSINDEIIPFKLGKKLFDAASEPKEFLQIIGGHNTGHIDSGEKFVKGVSGFLKKLGLVR